MYHFSEFTVSLNEMEDGIAPTDSRLRKDQQLMEETLWDEANAEKQVSSKRVIEFLKIFLATRASSKRKEEIAKDALGASLVQRRYL